VSQENKDAVQTEQSQYLSFYIAGEEYAIGILRVKEIIEYTTVTKLPSTPPSIRGVINLRGSVVPVVDLAIRFGLPESPVTKWTCIVMVEVVLEGEQMVLGIVVDSVSQVIDLLPKDIEPPPAFGTRARADFLQGMGKVGKKFVLILDLERLMAAGDLITSATEAQAQAEAANADGMTPEAPSTPPVSEPARP
jgi:purine-binding chemotaxis protein CheW